MKYFIAFVIALIVDSAAVFMMAVVLSVWNISLKSRGICWPSESIE